MPLVGSLGLGQSQPHCSHVGVGPENDSVSRECTRVRTGSGHPFTILYVRPVAPGAVLPLW